MVAFADRQQALDAIDEINRRYKRHCSAAREVAHALLRRGRCADQASGPSDDSSFPKGGDGRRCTNVAKAIRNTLPQETKRLTAGRTKVAQRALLLVALNAGLASLVHLSAPTHHATPIGRIRHVGQHGLDANCPWSIYCYRVLVPVALEQLPFDAEQRWRWYQLVATASAGTITSL